ncbi:alkaline phosphatase D family protein [Bacteroidota bacterium]
MERRDNIFLLILLLLSASKLLSCTGGESKKLSQLDSLNTGIIPATIAFGSCSHEYDDNQLWEEVMTHDPDIWIWMGDNIYGDSYYMNVLSEKYERQKMRDSYQKLLNSRVNIIGTWDDHDYGINDGGRYYYMKKESKELMLEFLDVPLDHPVRQREGVYQSYTFGKDDKQVKVILLDTRNFRDSLNIDFPENKRTYVGNPDGDILGEEQWKWLANELTESNAVIHIIGSSIQVLSEEHRWEKWSNFPKSRERLFQLLVSKKPVRTLFLSGDRHIAEISRIEIPGYPYPLYDFTSSGLTHTWDNASIEPNKHRVSDFIIAKNFGLINIDWKPEGPEVLLQIKGGNNVLLEEYWLEW